MRSLLLSSAFLLAACGSSSQPASAEAQSQSGGMTDEEFDARLREALMRNPQVILEAVEAYQERLEANSLNAARDVVAGMLADLVSGEHGHAVGASADEAELVIVEFFDYNCGVCRSAMPSVLAYTEDDPKVRLVFQEYPVIAEHSRQASRIAVAAGKLGDDAYLNVHRALLQGGAPNDAAINSALARAGFDAEAIANAVAADGDDIDALIDRSMAMGRQIGSRGTPFFIVANPSSGMFDVMDGYHPEGFRQLVERVAGSSSN